jgi:hypothetical protein
MEKHGALGESYRVKCRIIVCASSQSLSIACTLFECGTAQDCGGVVTWTPVSTGTPKGHKLINLCCIFPASLVWPPAACTLYGKRQERRG